MKFNHALKHQEKMDKKETYPDFYTSRMERRREREKLKKFLTCVPDKDWFESVKFEDQQSIYREYYYRKTKVWHLPSIADSDMVKVYWQVMKNKYPGDLSKRRNSVINKLLG